MHPDFEYFTELPGLGEVLCHQVRLWSVGLQEGIEYDAGLMNTVPTYRYAPLEIFPVGGFIYLTDEVFETEPQLALRIVQLFFDKIAKLKRLCGPACPGRQVEDASLLWRLCVRPELMEYLIKYCEEHEEELEAGDADMERFVPKMYQMMGTHTDWVVAGLNCTPCWPKQSTLSKTKVGSH